MVLSKLNEGTTMNSWQKQTLSSMAKVSSMLVRTGQARDRTAALRKLRAMDTSLVDEEGAPIEYSYDLNPTTGRQELTWLAPSIEHTTAMSRGMYNNPAKGTTGNSWKKQVLSSQAKVPAMLVRTGQARDLKAAWAKLKGMDTSLVDEEGEPIAYSYDFNPTTRRQELTWYAPSIEHTTAMSSGMYNNPNGRVHARQGSSYRTLGNPAQTEAQTNAAEAMRLFHSGEASSLQEAWDIVRSGAARPRKRTLMERAVYRPRTGAANAQNAAKAMRLFHSGQASSLQEAWDMVKGTQRLTNSRSR